MLLAQITDLHIKKPGLLAYKKVDTTKYLHACVDKLNRLSPRPGALIITGDLTDFGVIEEYQALRRELERLQMPFYLAVGNHDHRDTLRQAFPDHTYLGVDGFVQYTLDFEKLSLIVLDSQDLPNSGGRLCEQRLQWLAEQLQAQRGKPTIIAMHHPPFLCGVEHMDKQSLNRDDAHQLEELLRNYENIERLICGHVHRGVMTRFAHSIASICPSPAHQVAYDLNPNGPSAFVMEPPAFHVHANIDKNWVTHTVYVEDYGGHYPFYDAQGKLID